MAARPSPTQPTKEVPTLEQFAPRFLDGHARANQQKAEWTDLDLATRLICVQRNEWEGHVDSTKGGRL